MTHKEYNGWTNYETWIVKLWIDNEQGLQRYWRQQAEFMLSPAGKAAHRLRFLPDVDTSIRALAEQLKDEHEESLPKLEGFAADLMNAALSEVNWEEIANSLLEDAKEALVD